MYEKLRAQILPRLISPNAKVMVAVSGGPDSMALSHILWRYARQERSMGISLVLTHVHHGVREESDQEVHLVQEMAAKWEIPCIIHRFDAKGYAKLVGQSFQEAAREWRYARWKEDMIKQGCTLLATAHHLGDQAETILYRLLRGSGTAGLAGIYPSKGSIIRPLLAFAKQDILNYCAHEDLPYALDCSNDEPVYVRNRIRLELLPVLEKNYNLKIQEALGRTGELLRWDEEYLAQQVEVAWRRYNLKDADGTIGLSRGIFDESAAILSRLLRKAAMLVSNEPRGLGFSYVVKIMESQGKPDWMQDLPGLRVKITNQGIWFRSYTAISESDGASIPFQNKALPDMALGLGRWSGIPSLQADIGLCDEVELSSTLGTLDKCEKNMVAVFSRDLLVRFPNQLVCRTRRQGDKMWFQDVGHKSIKKVFQEETISVDVRDKLPLIACGTDVLWIPGVRQSDLYRPNEDSKRIYCILRPWALSAI
ncbi:tRNA lysidine(34) synthetase TilS [Desulfosporosinus sp. Sb-LF]|uniref:tRNA lysidine(34) synthetase TilS n=1 Tax=Desulfosporosinus sp. Sb-LF TaxID=2560027 RepID=UPI00107F2A64|nr:tRNA lysidine(34) synthetase TilS [Desulfosporosinus sp. Sb-LF]TGE34089.1 tRNA lysidine(34) synthetase TilS [Desulfosporosinus sp. Sb-LF]